LDGTGATGIEIVSEDIIELFEEAGAYLRGHFLLTSGLHSDVYFEKFALLSRPDILSPLVGRLAAPYRNQNIATVVGPTVGGVIIAFELARQLGCRAVYAEADGDQRVLKRGFSLVPGERVLVCDDILTTGRSVLEVVEMLEGYKSSIVGIALLLDRSGGEITFRYPLTTLTSVRAQTFQPAECPLCTRGVELTKRGSRTSIS
jgi:orotate phosphoribosyltransferase